MGQLERASVDSLHGYAFCFRMKLFENLGMFFGHEALDLPDVAEARHHFPVIFDRRFDRIELKAEATQQAPEAGLYTRYPILKLLGDALLIHRLEQAKQHRRVGMQA